MLGSAVFRFLTADISKNVYGTVRSVVGKKLFSVEEADKIYADVDVLNADDLVEVVFKTKPDVIINCVGLIKQVELCNNPLDVLPINSLLPHRLEKICAIASARLIHISTDCVYSGRKGDYKESDISDAEDLYGKSKFIGEVSNSENAVTLRTSIIGHELNSKNSLVDWFLSQSGVVKGYKNAIFSGVPTVELARIIRDFVLDKPQLTGLYHVSADPIDKYSLLRMVSSVYGRDDIIIQPDTEFTINRSLDSSRFRNASGYKPLGWPELIKNMYNNR